MAYVPPPFQRGYPRPDARRLDGMLARARSNRTIGSGALSSREGYAGKTMWLDPEVAGIATKTFWIELGLAGTGTKAGFYAWTQIVGVKGTYDWEYEGGSGTVADDPAIEANGCATLKVGTRVEVRRERVTNQVRFQMEDCSTTKAGATGGGTGNPQPPPDPGPAPPPYPTPAGFFGPGLIVFPAPPAPPGGGTGSPMPPPTPDPALPTPNFLPPAYDGPTPSVPGLVAGTSGNPP